MQRTRGLKLQNGWFNSLGVSALPSGKLTQIRLYAGDEWLLRPVIRVKSVQLDPGNCNPPVPVQPDPTTTPSGSTPTHPSVDTTPVGSATPMPPPPDTCSCGSASMYCYNGSCAPIVL